MATNKNQKVTDLAIRRAIQQSDGNLSEAARRLGVNVNTIHRRKKQNPKIQETINDHKEQIVDMAMDSLKSNLKKGNAMMTQYTLDRLGEERGFGDPKLKQLELESENGQSVNLIELLNLKGLTFEEKATLKKALKLMSDAQTKRLAENGED
jgi:transposase-like protein